VRRAPARVEARAPAPDADELYRAAHQAHFGRADYAEALALWDRYLAQAEPGHRWKIEARYNRAIALYRLGQMQLAREALEPFARGEYGGYRRAEAQRLLEAAAHPE
jgi:outer membrane protein assembly factor BamD (BamD/ComL family)